MGQMLGKSWASADPAPTPAPASSSNAIEDIIKIIDEKSLLVPIPQMNNLIHSLIRTSPWFLNEEKLRIDKWKLVGLEMKEFYSKNGNCQIFPEVFYLYNLILLDLSYQEEFRRRKSSKKAQRRKREEQKIEDRQTQDIARGQGDLNEESEGVDSDCPEEISTPPREQIIDQPTSTPPSGTEGGGVVGGAVTSSAPPPPPTQSPPSQQLPTPVTRLERGLIEAIENGKEVDNDFKLQIFPVIQQRNSAGQESRRYAPFNMDVLKNLKKSCTVFGATSDYVKMLIHNLAYETLTPSDWKVIAKVCLEPGQNLLWLSEFTELCRIQAQQNSQNAANTSITYDLLMGIGSYADALVQINYSITAFEQISAAAIKAWASLPSKNYKGETYTKIVQGPNEPFADFVARLQTAVIQANGENEVTDTLVRQLARDNANEVCRRIILGLRKDAPLEEIIRRCAAMGTNTFYSQAMVQTSQDPNMGRQDPFWQGVSRETRQCFQCGKVGHLKAQCWHRDRVRRQAGRTRPKTPCPKCNRGLHWASESATTLV
ncbi:endogenous retrovirus group K member 5 Gag polyprotein-like [Sminthopsis crassicaudata]|uniref:endogenous retrovirus group K member 5 Gag polyprotein-like n=1 Tax=Sminthopsis crassicaudata TaxID=9301 RepID=UPI003D69C299